MYEVLDGQQRITSFGRFVKDKFSVLDSNKMPQYFTGLDKEKQDKILKSKLTIYVCEGEEEEIKDWFKTINIAGIPLNDQEIWNAVYSGPFVSAAKAEFSNSTNAKMQKWKSYVKGDERRQQILSEALSWVSKGAIKEYMTAHRNDTEITELKTYFETVIDWASGVFDGIEDEMCGLEWGRLYETYHKNPYNKAKVWARVRELYEDGFVRNRKGIFEFILGGEKDTRLLDVRVFEPKETKAVYEKQKNEAEKMGVSNCPLCAVGHAANAKRIWKFNEMDAESVASLMQYRLDSVANNAITHINKPKDMFGSEVDFVNSFFEKPSRGITTPFDFLNNFCLGLVPKDSMFWGACSNNGKGRSRFRCTGMFRSCHTHS